MTSNFSAFRLQGYFYSFTCSSTCSIILIRWVHAMVLLKPHYMLITEAYCWLFDSKLWIHILCYNFWINNLLLKPVFPLGVSSLLISTCKHPLEVSSVYLVDFYNFSFCHYFRWRLFFLWGSTACSRYLLFWHSWMCFGFGRSSKVWLKLFPRQDVVNDNSPLDVHIGFCWNKTFIFVKIWRWNIE